MTVTEPSAGTCELVRRDGRRISLPWAPCAASRYAVHTSGRSRPRLGTARPSRRAQVRTSAVVGSGGRMCPAVGTAAASSAAVASSAASGSPSRTSRSPRCRLSGAAASTSICNGSHGAASVSSTAVTRSRTGLPVSRENSTTLTCRRGSRHPGGAHLIEVAVPPRYPHAASIVDVRGFRRQRPQRRSSLPPAWSRARSGASPRRTPPRRC